MCQRFWYALCGVALSFSSDANFIRLIVAKPRPFKKSFQFCEWDKITGAMSDEYGGPESSLTSFKKSWTMLIRWFKSTRRQNSGIWEHIVLPHVSCRNMHKNCMAWANRYTDILGKFFNSDLTILHNNFRHCLNVFINCWPAEPPRVAFVINIHSGFCVELVLLINISIFCTKYTRQMPQSTFQVSWCTSFYFSTQNLIQILLSNFFDSKNRQTHQNTSTFYIRYYIYIIENALKMEIAVNFEMFKKFKTEVT